MSANIADLISEKMPTFSKGQKRIAEAILQNYDKTAYMTAAKLGKTVGVSESTVVRFANELGFEGYPEFQRAVQELVRTKLTPNQRIEVTSARIANGDYLTCVLNGDIDRIRKTLDGIDRNAFDLAVKAVNAARRVYIFGVRSSSSLASFLHFNLSMIRDNVKLLQPTSSSEVFEQILDIDEHDVLIAISFPRYSRKVVNSVKYAKNCGARVIALTDSPLAPLAECATYLLTAQSDMVSFADSLIAPFSVINALLAAVAKERPQEVKERFDKLEILWDEYNIYAKQ